MVLELQVKAALEEEDLNPRLSSQAESYHGIWFTAAWGKQQILLIKMYCIASTSALYSTLLEQRWEEKFTDPEDTTTPHTHCRLQVYSWLQQIKARDFPALFSTLGSRTVKTTKDPAPKGCSFCLRVLLCNASTTAHDLEQGNDPAEISTWRTQETAAARSGHQPSPAHTAPHTYTPRPLQHRRQSWGNAAAMSSFLTQNRHWTQVWNCTCDTQVSGYTRL